MLVGNTKIEGQYLGCQHYARMVQLVSITVSKTVDKGSSPSIVLNIRDLIESMWL